MKKLFTIGFTQKGAEKFFTLLRGAGVRRVLDIRLRTDSQLAAFAKRDDLRYFLRELCGADYSHVLGFAPTEEMLDAYKKSKGSWQDYEKAFLPLIAGRRIEELLPVETLDRACLLCSESEPEHCHRRLVAEYLSKKIPGLSVQHL